MTRAKQKAPSRPSGNAVDLAAPFAFLQGFRRGASVFLSSLRPKALIPVARMVDGNFAVSKQQRYAPDPGEAD